MIQAERTLARSLDARRVVGLLLVVALVLVAFAGAAHAIGHAGGVHAGEDVSNDCSVCDAVLASAGASLPAPAACALVAQRGPRALLPPPQTPHVRSVTPRDHAPRGPPAVA